MKIVLDGIHTCPQCGQAHAALADFQRVVSFPTHGGAVVGDCGACGWDFPIRALTADAAEAAAAAAYAVLAATPEESPDRPAVYAAALATITAHKMFRAAGDRWAAEHLALGYAEYCPTCAVVGGYCGGCGGGHWDCQFPLVSVGAPA